MRMSKSALPELGVGPRTGPPAPTITWITDEANLSIRIGYKNIPVNLGGAPKAIQISGT